MALGHRARDPFRLRRGADGRAGLAGLSAIRQSGAVGHAHVLLLRPRSADRLVRLADDHGGGAGGGGASRHAGLPAALCRVSRWGGCRPRGAACGHRGAGSRRAGVAVQHADAQLSKCRANECRDRPRQRDAGNEGGGAHPRGAGGQHRQKPVPGQYEPRDPHADERHSRLQPSRAAHRHDAEAARLCREDQGGQCIAAEPDQRHPGFLQDRGRQADAGDGALRPARLAGSRVQHGGRAGAGEGYRARHSPWTRRCRQC